MNDSKVSAIAEEVGFWKVWEEIENAVVDGCYLNNMELHWLIARNAEVDHGYDAAEAAARSHGFDGVAHMLKNVKEQALEDLDTRTFDW